MTKLILQNITRIKILNRYYRITKFYSFMQNIAFKTVLILGLIILLYLALDHFIVDTEVLFNSLVSKFSPLLMFSIFFTSEFLLGLIPPEFFIAWTSKTINPWLHVFLLGSLSYLVGILAYYLGKFLFQLKAVKVFLEKRVSKYTHSLKKWGGFFIVAGAMLPIPYSMVSLTSGLINYHIKYYLFWSLFRYLRFFLYALVVFRMI